MRSLGALACACNAIARAAIRAAGDVPSAVSPTVSLSRVGGNLYGDTPESGDPAIGTASTGGRGAIAAGSLEQSNVDMASELTDMIVAQRDYTANSKVVQTSSDLLDVLMNLKR